MQEAPRSIGQSDEGFQPSRKSVKSAPALSLAMNLSADAGGCIRTVPEPQNPSLFFTGGRQHFDIMTKGEMRKLHELFTRAVHCTAIPLLDFKHQE